MRPTSALSGSSVMAKRRESLSDSSSSSSHTVSTTSMYALGGAGARSGTEYSMAVYCG